MGVTMRRSKLNTCYPAYRYCGPKCSGPGNPTNPVDRCCLSHDRCYERFGNTKYCDDIFQQCLRPYKNPYTRMGRNANLFSNFITLKNRFY